MQRHPFTFNIPKDIKEAFNLGFHYGNLTEQIYLLEKGVRRICMIECKIEHSKIFENFMEKEKVYYKEARNYIEGYKGYSVSYSKRYLELFMFFDERIVDKKTTLFSFTVKNKIYDFIIGIMLGYSFMSCVKYILTKKGLK